MQGTAGVCNRQYGRILGGIVAVAALVRLGRLALIWNRPLLLNDSIYYSAQARGLAEGRLFLEPFSSHPGAEHGPLTSLFMASVSWIGDAIPWQRAITVPFGIASVYLVAVVARRIGGNSVALVAAAAAAVYPNLWLSDGLVMSESFAITAVLAVLVVATRSGDHTRAGALALGVLIGIAGLIRSELLLLAPLLAVMMIRQRSRGSLARGLVVLIAAAGVISPWVAFNVARFERPVLLTTNEGGLLLGTNSPDTYWGPNIGGWSLVRLLEEMESVPEVAARDASVRSAHMRTVGIEFAAENWRRLPVVVVARVGRLVDLYGIDAQLAQDAGEERGALGPRAGVVAFWLLAPFAMLGAIVMGRSSRGRDIRSVILSPIVIAVIVAAAFYGTHRLRAPAEPSIVMLAAVGVVAALQAAVTRAGSR